MHAVKMARGVWTATRRQVAPQRRQAPSPHSRRPVVRIAAYKDGRDAHREEVICATGKEVVGGLMRALQHGPDDDVRATLQANCNTDIKYRRDQVMKHQKGRGLEFLYSTLAQEHDALSLSHWELVASAACGTDDTYFGLVKFDYTSKLVKDAGSCSGYKILEFDFLVDDTTHQVTGIQERGQLSPEDVWCIASVDAASQLCGGTPFPAERLGPYPEGLPHTTVLTAQQAWCKARSTGKSEAVLDEVLDPSFRLWDAYGLLPVLCDPSRRAQPGACVVPHSAVKDIVSDFKAAYDIDCHLLDSAVSSAHNVGFTHWRSTVHNKDSGEDFTIDGIEVELFSPEGKLQDIWLFRDPMDSEKKVLGGGQQ